MLIVILDSEDNPRVTHSHTNNVYTSVRSELSKSLHRIINIALRVTSTFVRGLFMLFFFYYYYYYYLTNSVPIEVFTFSRTSWRNIGLSWPSNHLAARNHPKTVQCRFKFDSSPLPHPRPLLSTNYIVFFIIMCTYIVINDMF